MASFDPLTDPQKRAEAQLELTKMQQSGELARMANESETVKAYLADTASARQRDIEFLKSGRKNLRGDILAYIAVGSLGGCIIALFVAAGFKVQIDATVKDLLLLLTGALIVIVKDVYGFEFGSSKDSQRNAQAVADMLKGQ